MSNSTGSGYSPVLDGFNYGSSDSDSIFSSSSGSFHSAMHLPLSSGYSTSILPAKQTNLPPELGPPKITFDFCMYILYYV